MTGPAPARRAVAEGIGSAGLAAIVVGSGIAAQRLSPSDTGLQLLENAIATALGLTVLIWVLAPVSGAQFNPVVSTVDAALGGRPWRDVVAYVPAQVLGCVAGTVLANLMFEEPAVAWSRTDRLSAAHLLSEVVATAGLVFVIFALARTNRAALIAPAVGAYIGAAYFFTSSAGFANPAITVGRAFTDTFAGIAPSAVVAYVLGQVAGAALGWFAVIGLLPSSPRSTPTGDPQRDADPASRARPLAVVGRTDDTA